jgi:hypothetical protein
LESAQNKSSGNQHPAGPAKSLTVHLGSKSDKDLSYLIRKIYQTKVENVNQEISDENGCPNRAQQLPAGYGTQITVMC